MSGLKSGAVVGGSFGAAGGYLYAKQNNLNPWSGKSNIGREASKIANELGIHSTQKGIRNEIIDDYLQQMNDNSFLDNPRNKSVGGFKYQGKSYFNDGNHRINAAIEFYINTGDNTYINILIYNLNLYATPYSPNQYGLPTLKLPTRN